MKKKIIYTLIVFINLIFFTNFFTVKAAPKTEITSYIIFKDYKGCYKTTSADYLKTKSTDEGLMVYVAKKNIVLGFAINATEQMECIKNDNTKESVLFSIPRNAVVYTPDENNSNSNNSSSNNSGTNNSTSSDGSPSTSSDLKDCQGILGNPETEGTTANFLRKTLNFIQFCGPILAIVLTIMDFVRAVTSGDKDELTKMLKKMTKRIIYAVLLFIFPTILDIVLRWTNVYGTCGI